MKLFSLLVAGVLLLQSALAEDITFDEATLKKEFDDFRAKYHKIYPSDTQALRFQAFSTNYKRIQQHNAEAAAGKHSFTLAINELADMTNEEYRAKLGFKRGSSVMSSSSASSSADLLSSSLDLQASLPSSWDWRKLNVVGPVKNQGQCGSCWSFSAIAALEGLYANQTGKIVQFSEQEMVDCVKNGANTCDVGGYMEDVYEELIQHHGGKIQTEDQYPYTGKSLKKCKSDDSNAVGEFTGYVTLPNGDEKALLTAAYQRPVVAVAIDASAFSFQFYSSGVYNEPNCKKLYDELDHGVSVVGYGTDAKGGDYWIVRNSWGGSWGQKGYIWMSRNKDNQCGIATDASYPLWGPNKSLRRV